MNNFIQKDFSPISNAPMKYQLNDHPPPYPLPQNADFYNGMGSFFPPLLPLNSKVNKKIQSNQESNFHQNIPNQKCINSNNNSSPIKSANEESKSPKKETKNNSKNHNPNKDNYIHLLLNTIDNLFSSGEITMEYLNETNTNDKQEFNLDGSSELNENNFCKKCDNKVCTYLADNPHKLFQAKFIGSTSYKSKNLWLCEKCYKAYSLGNYCYYCHIVYRDYDHGTQYYDKKKWIQCDYCQKWHHMQCEGKKGKYDNIEELSLNVNFKYMCPFCRKDHESIMRQKHKEEKIKKNLMLNMKRKNNNENFEPNKIK
jgi:hypothetical protein